jgi:hypothetical protein
MTKAPKQPPDPAVMAKLRADQIEAGAAAWEARQGGAGFEAAFRRAHERLLAMPLQPVRSKADRLAAYDARMLAGYEWYPWKTRREKAERWLKLIDREIARLTNPRKGSKYYDPEPHVEDQDD